MGIDPKNQHGDKLFLNSCNTDPKHKRLRDYTTWFIFKSIIIILYVFEDMRHGTIAYGGMRREYLLKSTGDMAIS